MALLDLYESKEHSTNFAHFASIMYLSNLHESKGAKEELLLKRLAEKLAITSEEFTMISSNPRQYPIQKVTNSEKRLQRIFDLFKRL